MIVHFDRLIEDSIQLFIGCSSVQHVVGNLLRIILFGCIDREGMRDNLLCFHTILVVSNLRQQLLPLGTLVGDRVIGCIPPFLLIFV